MKVEIRTFSGECVFCHSKLTTEPNDIPVSYVYSGNRFSFRYSDRAFFKCPICKENTILTLIP